MNPFLSTKSDDNKLKPSQIFGGFDEIGFEMEAPSASAIVQGVGGVIKDIFSLGQDIAGEKTEMPEQKSNPEKFSSGSIEFKKKEEVEAKKIFYQALKDDTQRAEQAKNRMLFEEEINDVMTNLPTEQKNELLHYQASYKNNRSIYQWAELRKKLVEQSREADKKQKEVSIAQTAPRASAMNAAFEGGSGTQGSGQGNLSFQATG